MKEAENEQKNSVIESLSVKIGEHVMFYVFTE